MNILKCSECKKVFSTRYNLRKHIRKFHSDKADILAPKRTFNFQCEQCNRNFTHQRHLRYHKKKHEPVPPIPQKNKKCPLCDYWGHQMKQLLKHFTQEHNIKIHTSTHSFSCFENFKVWKDKVENETKTHFIKSRGATVIKARKIVHYVCHRSGTFISKSKGLRHLKNQGSNKINSFCPGAIKVVISKNGECQVTFYETHIGHDNDLNHLWLSPLDKEQIASKIADKVPFSEILDEVKNSQSERIQLLTRKDLHNIKQTMKLRQTQSTSSKYEEEELIMDCSDADDSLVTEPKEVLQETPTTPQIENDSYLLLNEEKQKLTASVNKLINEISSFEEIETFKKVLNDASLVINSGNSVETENNDVTEETTQKQNTPRLLLITRTRDVKDTQTLHYGDHDYAHPGNSVYKIQFHIDSC